MSPSPRRIKTSSGIHSGLSAEMTAYDLIRYRKGAGSIDHVATVLSELAERMNQEALSRDRKAGRESRSCSDSTACSIWPSQRTRRTPTKLVDDKKREVRSARAREP